MRRFALRPKAAAGNLLSAKKAQLQEEIENLSRQIDEMKTLRKQTPHHIPVKDLPESDRFSRLLTERKHFIDTIKLIAYRAETSMPR
jgi:hypothetical protein